MHEFKGFVATGHLHGEFLVPSRHVATAHGPSGVLSAPGIGLARAELIEAGAPRSLDLCPFDPARRLGVWMSVPGTMPSPAADRPLG